MSCEVFNESDFGMIEGCQQIFTVNLYNIFYIDLYTYLIPYYREFITSLYKYLYKYNK